MKKIFLLFSILVWAVSCQSTNDNKDKHDDHANHNHNHDQNAETKKGVELLAQEAECHSCGMPSNSNASNWSVKHAPPQKDETVFCSPGCYFKASFSEKEYRTGEYVTFSVFGEKNKTVEAKKAFFVSGSSEKNPMGRPDFLVVDSAEKAKKLQTEKQAKEVFTFEKITPESIKGK